jgi:hypothetical protein
MKLVFQTDWQPMKRTQGFLVLSEIIIQFLGISDGSIKEYFVQTVDLLYR